MSRTAARPRPRETGEAEDGTLLAPQNCGEGYLFEGDSPKIKSWPFMWRGGIWLDNSNVLECIGLGYGGRVNGCQH